MTVSKCKDASCDGICNTGLSSSHRKRVPANGSTTIASTTINCGREWRLDVTGDVTCSATACSDACKTKREKQDARAKDKHTEKIKKSLEEIEIQEENVATRIEELSQAVEQGLVDTEIKTEIVEQVQSQTEVQMDILEEVETSLVERGSDQTAISVQETAEYYIEVRTEHTEELQEAGEVEIIPIEDGIIEEEVIIIEET